MTETRLRKPNVIRSVGPANAVVLAGDLAMARELAEEHGVARSTITGWWVKIGMPLPVAHLAAGAIYDASAVRKWRKGYLADQAAAQHQAAQEKAQKASQDAQEAAERLAGLQD